MYRISVDTGGTFTDVVVTDADGLLTIGKALTTPERSFAGLSNAIRHAAEQLGIEYERLLSEASMIVYGTTRATNAIVERKVGKTALLVTEGFPDVLVYRQGGKLNALQLNIEFPPPYIPKSLTFEIPERVDAEGGVVLPIDKGKVKDVVQTLRRRNVEAVAVCFLWSIINPDHEREVGKILSELLPAVPYTLSHELNPIIREYPRASSSAIDASLKPLMQKHLDVLKNDLRAAGFHGELLISSSSGGVMHIDDVTRKPIYMAKSGPAMAPLAGIASTKAEGLDDDVIVVDTGGTTFDVALIRAGRIKYSRETWLGPKYISTLLGMATVDIRSVGSGGGSIAWVDAGGMLRVGPQSAGSVPGPACYDKGGERATVTDAAVALGYIDPGRFLGGRMQLNSAKAVAVVNRIAERLGKTTNETASAILQISSETMIKAIEDITINDGVNPRESVLVAGGGAAGLNILSIAQSLGCRQVIIPKTAGALSAAGAQHSDIAIDFSIAAHSTSNAFDHQKIRNALAKLKNQADLFEGDLRNKGVNDFRQELFVEARYVGQQWEIEVAVLDNWEPEQGLELKTAFDTTHQRLYTVSQPEAPIETINWRLRLTAVLPRPSKTRPTYKSKDVYERRSSAYFANAGVLDARVIDGTSLDANIEIGGPAIIEEPNTTIVIPPGIAGHLTNAGNYVFTLGGKNA
jgi:N-methylhydantoinase A